jgi:DNA-directed RNA polymerase specialized sigma subunit
MSEQRPLPVTGAVLYHLYVEQRRSVSSLAQLYGVTDTTVRKWLESFQIKPHPRGRPKSVVADDTNSRHQMGMWAILGRAYAEKVVHEGKVYRHPRLAGLRNAIGTLSPREGTALCLRYGLLDKPPMTYHEIARYFGISRGRGQQMVDRAIHNLRRKRRYDYIYSSIRRR